MKTYIPKILLYSRLLFTLAIALLSIVQPNNSRLFVLLLMYAGIIADIFDGIIARRLNISTENLRLLDTGFDLLFYFSILFFISSVNLKALLENTLLIRTIIILECSMYFISLIRFRKLPSPHSILSKFWGLYLVVEFTLLTVGINGYHFTIALTIGTIVHIDRVLIYLIIKQWDHDIPSCFHALQLRNGKIIKRIKLFNG